MNAARFLVFAVHRVPYIAVFFQCQVAVRPKTSTTMNKIFSYSMEEFAKILTESESIQKMYNAVCSDDLSDAVMTAMEIINETKLHNQFHYNSKSEDRSTMIRIQGNRAFCYKEALILFNSAIAAAPQNSEAMFLAYSDRSKLLLKVQAINACLEDTERCLGMDCPKEIAGEFRSRKQNCMPLMLTENLKNNALSSQFGIEYFKFNRERNNDVPCLSASVHVVKENGSNKIVAAKDIEVGNVVAVEPAFAAVLDINNKFTSCYHCHKLSLTLIPCDGCTSALFCNEKCKEQCMKDYHKIECQIRNVIEANTYTAKCELPVVAALKIREMCDSWEDFVSCSMKIGKRGMEEGSVREIYDHNHKSSILCFNDEKHFPNGVIFNQSFLYAVIIKCLSDIPDYLPQSSKERSEAQRALARIMISLYINFSSELEIQNAAQNFTTRNTSSEPEPNIGLFSMASKLTHSCEPNLLGVGLGNKLALIAIKPIKKGTELSISYTGFWGEVSYEEVRSARLFNHAGRMCQCRVCLEGWGPFTAQRTNTSNEKQRCFRIWRSALQVGPLHSKNQFMATCQAFKKFQDSPHTQEYCEIFRELRNRLTIFQYSYTKNEIL